MNDQVLAKLAQIADQRDELIELSNKIKLAEAVKQHVERLGIEWPESNFGHWAITRQIDQLAGGIDWNVRSQFVGARRQLDELIKLIDKIQGRDDEQVPQVAE